MKICHILRNYFYFSRGEQRGILLLIIFLVLIFLANCLIFKFERREGLNENIIKQFYSLGVTKTKNKIKSNLSLFSFDPNVVDSLKLDSLNLPFLVKKNLLSYRRHKGKLKYKKDFLRIYGMNDSIYSRVEKYIVINNKPVIAQKATIVFSGRLKKKYKKRIIVHEKSKAVEINSANAYDYKKLCGIGEVLSERIIKYRRLLGGFYSKEQLLEVYGLPVETFLALKSCLKVDTIAIVKLNINFLGFRELVFHPYLCKEDVKRILNYRDSVGFIEDKKQLLENSVLDDTVYNKISHYLEVKTVKGQNVAKSDIPTKLEPKLESNFR